jgi:hypothetical protein
MTSSEQPNELKETQRDCEHVPRLFLPGVEKSIWSGRSSFGEPQASLSVRSDSDFHSRCRLSPDPGLPA